MSGMGFGMQLGFRLGLKISCRVCLNSVSGSPKRAVFFLEDEVFLVRIESWLKERLRLSKEESIQLFYFCPCCGSSETDYLNPNYRRRARRYIRKYLQPEKTEGGS